jgi:hypothetical protein
MPTQASDETGKTVGRLQQIEGSFAVSRQLLALP